jgi:hypothetical protein
MTSNVFSERQPFVALVAVAAIILQAGAGLAFAAVYGFDVSHDFELGVLLAGGSGTATAFRLALVIDMLSYLSVAPLVVFLHGLWPVSCAPSASQAGRMGIRR